MMGHVGSFVVSNEPLSCGTLMEGGNIVGMWGYVVCGNSVSSAKFCCEAKLP